LTLAFPGGNDEDGHCTAEQLTVLGNQGQLHETVADFGPKVEWLENRYPSLHVTVKDSSYAISEAELVIEPFPANELLMELRLPHIICWHAVPGMMGVYSNPVQLLL